MDFDRAAHSEDRLPTAVNHSANQTPMRRDGRRLQVFRECGDYIGRNEPAHRILKRQFSFGRGRYRNFGSLNQIWGRALA